MTFLEFVKTFCPDLYQREQQKLILLPEGMTVRPVTSDEQLPFVSCICPTFRRPDLVANAVACWLAQDYPADRRQLIVIDDGGVYSQFHWIQGAEGYARVFAGLDRFASLGAKYNHGLRQVDEQCELVLPWEDDDIYLPWHIRAHADVMTALPECVRSEPRLILSTYRRRTDVPDWNVEPGAGRFHGNWAFRRSALQRVGGWPETERRTFDVELADKLATKGETAHPLPARGPSYVYRWGNAPNASGLGTDTTWWQTAAEIYPPVTRDRLVPQFDSQTLGLFQAWGIPCPDSGRSDA